MHERVTKEIIKLAATKLKLIKPSQDDVIVKGAQVWKMSIEDVSDTLRSIINLHTTTRLFSRHYGHLFQQDEDGNPVLNPPI
ncbi:MAG: hypothetical protein HOD85_21670 [Deltaproteobacteria bacterium]|jgi:hypothetical protein|nr:hypothetical protein [Deltaproteobacteria bacterium]MBT4638829.1 hypothetical protein [Deltaproteobacteria bacterium]